MKLRIVTVGAAACCVLSVIGLHAAETNVNARPLTKEQLLHQLTTRQSRVELEEARADMEMARAELEQIQRLFDEKVVAADELNKAKQAHEKATLRYQTAEIQLQKTQLEFLRDNTFIMVTDAVKYRTDDGRYMVAVGLRNDSDLDKSRTLMAEGGFADEALTNLLRVDNLVVSLRGPATSCAPIIGDPYQRIVPAIRYGETRKIEFDLLDRAVEEATIQLEFLGAKHDYTVKLKKDTARDVPTIASIQYAQEGKLGSQIKYDLELERLASSEQSFSLTVLNLPRAIPFAFIDPGSGARVTHIKFTEERSTQHLQLEISIPAKLDAKYVDANIDFSVFVTRPAELAAIGEIVRKHEDDVIPAEEVQTIKGNRVDLKLIPTGVGKLDILIANLFNLKSA